MREGKIFLQLLHGAKKLINAHILSILSCFLFLNKILLDKIYKTIKYLYKPSNPTE